MFVTKTSKASSRYPRARFTTSSDFSRHFHRGRNRPQSRRYHVRNIRPGLLDECVRAYSSPIRGSEHQPDLEHTRFFRPARHSKTTTKSSRQRSRRDRRRYRRSRNEVRCYPAGSCAVPVQRAPAPRPIPNARHANRDESRSQRTVPPSLDRRSSKCSVSRPSQPISSNEVASSSFRSSSRNRRQRDRAVPSTRRSSSRGGSRSHCRVFSLQADPTGSSGRPNRSGSLFPPRALHQYVPHSLQVSWDRYRDARVTATVPLPPVSTTACPLCPDALAEFPGLTRTQWFRRRHDSLESATSFFCGRFSRAAARMSVPGSPANAIFLHQLPSDVQRNVRSRVDHDLAPKCRVNLYDLALPFGLSLTYLFKVAIDEALILDCARNAALDTVGSDIPVEPASLSAGTCDQRAAATAPPAPSNSATSSEHPVFSDVHGSPARHCADSELPARAVKHMSPPSTDSLLSAMRRSTLCTGDDCSVPVGVPAQPAASASSLCDDSDKLNDFAYFAVADRQHWGVHACSRDQIIAMNPVLYKGFDDLGHACSWLQGLHVLPPPPGMTCSRHASGGIPDTVPPASSATQRDVKGGDRSCADDFPSVLSPSAGPTSPTAPPAPACEFLPPRGGQPEPVPWHYSDKLAANCQRVMHAMSVVPTMETRRQRQIRIDAYLAAATQLAHLRVVARDIPQCAVNVPAAPVCTASVLIVGTDMSPSTSTAGSTSASSTTVTAGSSSSSTTRPPTIATAAIAPVVAASPHPPSPPNDGAARHVPDDRSPLPQDSLVRDGTVSPSVVEQLYDSDYATIPNDIAAAITDSLADTASETAAAMATPPASTSPTSACLPTTSVDASMPPPPPRKPKRKFRGHGWSKKGSKLSRAQRNLRVPSSPRMTPAVPRQSVPPISICPVTPPSSGADSAICSSGVPLARATPPSPESSPDDRQPRRFNHGPRSDLAFHSDSVSVRETTDHASCSAVFRHPTGLAMSRHLRSARSVYAYAHGLHTTLHYPQVFSVRLLGEPATLSDGSSAPHHTVGNPAAARAISETLRTVTDLDAHPRSLCNHPGCIYNQGDAVTRRQRHQLSIGYLNQSLERNEHSLPFDGTNTPSRDHGSALVTASVSAHRTVLDSGASRHLETDRSGMTNIRPCSPVNLLQGISGLPISVAVQGSVDNCHNVLLAPDVSASVRSVSALIDSHSCSVLFTPSQAYIVTGIDVPPSAVAIATRGEDGLFHIRRGTIPRAPSSASIFLSIPQQIKREQVHRLHRCLGHASPSRMASTIKMCPEVRVRVRVGTRASVSMFASLDRDLSRLSRCSGPWSLLVSAVRRFRRLFAKLSQARMQFTGAKQCARNWLLCEKTTPGARSGVRPCPVAPCQSKQNGCSK